MSDEDQSEYLKKELYELFGGKKELIQLLEQGSMDGMWYWDIEKPDNEWLSPKFKETFGYNDSEIKNSPEWWQANIFQEDLDKVLDNYHKHIADPNHPYDQIVRYKHKNGGTVWIRCRGFASFNDKGEPIRMFGSHSDVTPLMEARQELEILHEKLKRSVEVNELAIQNAQIGIWTWELNKNNLIWSPEMTLIHGLDQQAPPAKLETWKEIIHKDDREKFQEFFDRLIETDHLKTSTFRITNSDNNKIKFINLSARLFKDTSDVAYRVLGTALDVTDEKTKESQLQTSNQELETFAYVASHDLKSPLRGVKQLTSWIAEDIKTEFETLPDSVEKNIELMNARINRMEQLLDDLLDYSRVNKNLEEEITQINLTDIIKNIFDLVKGNNSKVTLTIKGQLPIVYSIKTPLEQVLRNLIENAIKHNTVNTPTVYIEYNSSKWFHEFKIIDNGPGIPERHKERIFKMFQKLQSKDKVEGSGMGLTLAKKLVESAGGKLSFENIGVLETKRKPAHELIVNVNALNSDNNLSVKPIPPEQNSDETPEKTGCIFKFTWPKNHLSHFDRKYDNN